MRIHAVQTGSVMIKQAQMRGVGRGNQRLFHSLFDKDWTQFLPIYAWVIEHPEGVIVIDTGETARTAQPGYFPWWHPFFHLAVRVRVRPEEEIGPQLRALGIAPDDVRHVVLTHLHTDHAGGLHHFPQAQFLVARREYEAASGLNGRVRGYLPQHWPAWFKPTFVPFESVAYGPFPSSYTLTRAGDITLVPTPGHAPGHLSVILQEDDRFIFFAGDTSYTQQLMLEEAIDGVGPDEQAALQTIQRIHAYVRQTPTVYLPSHDPEAARRLQERETIGEAILS